MPWAAVIAVLGVWVEQPPSSLIVGAFESDAFESGHFELGDDWAAIEHTGTWTNQ